MKKDEAIMISKRMFCQVLLTILQIMKVFTIGETQIHEQRWSNDRMCFIHNFFLNTGAGEQENFIEISYSYVKFLTT